MSNSQNCPMHSTLSLQSPWNSSVSLFSLPALTINEMRAKQSTSTWYEFRYSIFNSAIHLSPFVSCYFCTIENQLGVNKSLGLCTYHDCGA